ncbi:MAG: DoxX family protein [Flavobacteriaceae bacterium]
MIKIRNEKLLKNSIVLLRLFIGWHFLYEGVIKLYNPSWTSFGYLASAQGPFRFFFQWMISEPLIAVADWLNILALIFVGITLILGVFEKWGLGVAIGLLAMYYLAHPSFPWVAQLNVEGSYWFINKNLIELMACVVIYQIPTADYFGINKVLRKSKELTKT